MDRTPEYPAFPDYPGCLAACWVPVLDPLTWYARSEIVNHRFQVSILTGPGRWTELTLGPEAMTHRLAVASAVHHLTGRTVTAVTASHPVGDNCPSYRVTVTARTTDQPDTAPATDTPTQPKTLPSTQSGVVHPRPARPPAPGSPWNRSPALSGTCTGPADRLTPP